MILLNHNKLLRNNLKKKFSTITGYIFEKRCVDLLKSHCHFFKVEKEFMEGCFKEKKYLKFIFTSKSWFFKCLNKKNPTLKKPHGCREPDVVFMFHTSIFILEFKYQNGSGSVAEKLQTGPFKKTFYSKVFLKSHKVFYIYVLSPWFRNNCVLELEYLKKEEVFYFFSDEN